MNINNRIKIKQILEKIHDNYTEIKVMDVMLFMQMIQRHLLTRFYVIANFQSARLMINGCSNISEHDGVMDIIWDEGRIRIKSADISRISTNEEGIFKIDAGRTVLFLVEESRISERSEGSSFWKTPYYDKIMVRHHKQKPDLRKYTSRDENTIISKSRMVAGNSKVRIYIEGESSN